jgi:hypothetical protein
MAFVISAISNIGGAKIQADSSEKAAKIAAQGNRENIEYLRESRDLARGDQAPYREAGTTALDALMSLTGLGGTGGGGSGQGATKAAPEGFYPESSWQGRVNNNIRNNRSPWDSFGSSYGSNGSDAAETFPEGRYSGGPMGGRAMYNINEMGPENVYSGGAISRNPNPMTISDKTGYVQPNIQGRYAGGAMGDEFPGGAYIPPNQVPPTVMDVPPYDPNNVVPGGVMGGQYGGGGQSPPNPGTANGGVMENPGGQPGGYNFMTDPGYNFRFNEGMRGLERGAAARGGLLSGGLAKKAIRYGQGMASNEYSNVYNRISNIAGLGQVSTGQSGQYAMMAGQGMGNSASNAANATAYGQVGAGNAWANAGNQVAQLPWGQVFGGGSDDGYTQGVGRQR